MRGDLVDTLEKLLRGLDNGRMHFPPRDHRDDRPRRSGAGAAHRDGASLSRDALPARRRHHGGRCGQRRRDARRACRGGQAGRGRRPHRADQDRPARHAGATRRRSACARACRAQSGGAGARRRRRRGDAAAPARLRPLRSRTQDPRREALARRGSLRGGTTITITTITT